MENPFEIPGNVDEELNEEIKEWIVKMINQNKLDFHTLLNRLEDAVEIKDVSRAKILGYYCANVVLKNKSYSDHVKSQTICDIRDILNKISN